METEVIKTKDGELTIDEFEKMEESDKNALKSALEPSKKADKAFKKAWKMDTIGK